MSWTQEDLDRHLAKRPRLERDAKGAPSRLLLGAEKRRTREKYGNEATAVGALRFDSKREAARYRELQLRKAAGQIRNLRCQPRYGLCPLIIDGADCRDINAGEPSGRRLPVVIYVADFEYEESHLGDVWHLIVEDVKGRRTEAYTVKKRWFEAQYGIQIRET